VLLAAFLLSGFASAALAESTSPGSAINRDVDKLVALYTDGFGHSEPTWRKIIFGPLFKPDSKDAIVFFAVTGMSLMNGRDEYLAVFAQGQGRSTPVAKERPYRMVVSAQVGTRWARTLDWETAKVSPGQIVVQGKRWGSKDAGCCPTEPIEVTFSVAEADGGDTAYPLLRQAEKPGRAKRD